MNNIEEIDYKEFLIKVRKERTYYHNLYQLIMRDRKENDEIASFLKIAVGRIEKDRKNIGKIMGVEEYVPEFLFAIGEVSDQKH